MGNDTAQGWGVCSWLATIDYYCHASHYFISRATVKKAMGGRFTRGWRRLRRLRRRTSRTKNAQVELSLSLSAAATAAGAKADRQSSSIYNLNLIPNDLTLTFETIS